MPKHQLVTQPDLGLRHRKIVEARTIRRLQVTDNDAVRSDINLTMKTRHGRLQQSDIIRRIASQAVQTGMQVVPVAGPQRLKKILGHRREEFSTAPTRECSDI